MVVNLTAQEIYALRDLVGSAPGTATNCSALTKLKGALSSIDDLKVRLERARAEFVRLDDELKALGV